MKYIHFLIIPAALLTLVASSYGLHELIVKGLLTLILSTTIYLKVPEKQAKFLTISILWIGMLVAIVLYFI